jgi:hypothetical protein
VACDSEGRLLGEGAHRPGRMHDQTAMKPKAPTHCSTSSTTCRPCSTTATAAWPATIPARPAARRRPPECSPR